MIPSLNLNELMLRKDVVEAVSQGKFHVYAISDIDQGIEILTGVKAGKMLPNGTYEEGSVNYLVDTKLKKFVDTLGVMGNNKVAKLSKENKKQPHPQPSKKRDKDPIVEVVEEKEKKKRKEKKKEEEEEDEKKKLSSRTAAKGEEGEEEGEEKKRKRGRPKKVVAVAAAGNKSALEQ